MHTHILDMRVHTHKYMQSLHKNFVYFVFFPLYILKFNNLVWVVIESLEVNLLNSRTTISYSYNNIHSDLWQITQMTDINKKIMDNLGYGIKSVSFFKLIWDRQRERERTIDLLFHLFMHSLVSSYVPWPGIKPTTLVYQNNALTNWATKPGPVSLFRRKLHLTLDDVYTVLLSYL